MEQQPLILIIDDDRVVHRLLAAMLRIANYRIIEAYSGEEGLTLVHAQKPDLVLLDIMMPEMNGFEAIQRIKADPETKEIPVIFLSAKSESGDKVHGLELGAADFVNKPFDRAELLARIKAHIKLKQQEEALKAYSQNLKQMVEERTRQLIHADRLASLGTLSAGIAHEINNPTTFITGNVQTMEQFWKKLVDFIDRSEAATEDPRIQYIRREFPAVLQSIRTGADRITNIVAGLKTFARKDTSAKEPLDIHRCLDEALYLTHNHLKYYLTVNRQYASQLPRVLGNSQQLTQVFVNLIVNSADAVGEREGHLTIITSLADQNLVRLLFSDDGPGMPPEVLAKIFDPFFTTKPVGQGTGLGLSISHGIIADHGGTIEVASQPGTGTTFTITLPTETAR